MVQNGAVSHLRWPSLRWSKFSSSSRSSTGRCNQVLEFVFVFKPSVDSFSVAFPFIP